MRAPAGLKLGKAPARWLAVLAASICLLVAWTVVPLSAQSPIGLDAVEPGEGEPGQELEVRLYGHGFESANQVHLDVEGIQVLESWVVSDEELGAVIRIPEDAPPGPRRVEVVANFGPDESFAADLPGGFRVLEAAAPPQGGQNGELPSDEGGGLGLLALLLGVALLGGAFSLTLRWRRSVRRRKWQSQATEQELPSSCQKGAQFVRREKVTIKPGRWKATQLTVTLYNELKGKPSSPHLAPPELVQRLDKVARQRLLRGDSASQRQEVEAIGRELTALILAWQSLSETGKDIFLETHLEGGKAEVTFVRYRCVGPPEQWRKQDEWRVTAKAVDILPRALPGPQASESREGYAAFLSDQVEAYLLALVEEAGQLF